MQGFFSLVMSLLLVSRMQFSFSLLFFCSNVEFDRHCSNASSPSPARLRLLPHKANKWRHFHPSRQNRSIKSFFFFVHVRLLSLGKSISFGFVKTFCCCSHASPWYGRSRPKWLGPIQFNYPQYLTGEYPGDYEFDVASLGEDPVTLQKYFNFEILHARWAMLGSLGVLVPELLDLLGIVHFVEPVWWRVGYAKLQGDTLDYLGIPGFHIAGSQGVIVIAICQALLMVGPEYARYCGIEALEPLGIYLPGNINYPGGSLFDPLGLSKDPSAFEELKVKEIKNGRLAMVAWLGFFLQAALTGKGPLQNLLDFISDPLHNNVISLLKPF